MSRRCPECHEPGQHAHLTGCSYAPNREEREEYVTRNAVALVRQLEETVSRQAKAIAMLEHRLGIREQTLALRDVAIRLQAKTIAVLELHLRLREETVGLLMETVAEARSRASAIEGLLASLDPALGRRLKQVAGTEPDVSGLLPEGVRIADDQQES